jgi:hypothetical protein
VQFESCYRFSPSFGDAHPEPDRKYTLLLAVDE